MPTCYILTDVSGVGKVYAKAYGSTCVWRAGTKAGTKGCTASAWVLLLLWAGSGSWKSWKYLFYFIFVQMIADRSRKEKVRLCCKVGKKMGSSLFIVVLEAKMQFNRNVEVLEDQWGHKMPCERAKKDPDPHGADPEHEHCLLLWAEQRLLWVRRLLSSQTPPLQRVGGNWQMTPTASLIWDETVELREAFPPPWAEDGHFCACIKPNSAEQQG